MNDILKKIHKELPAVQYSLLFDKHTGIIKDGYGNYSENELTHSTAVILNMLHNQQKVIRENFSSGEEISEVVFENPNLTSVVRCLKQQESFLYLAFSPSQLSLGLVLKVLKFVS